MLDLDELANLRDDPQDPSRALKRRVIVHTAIKAAEELAGKNSEADLTLVVEALEQLARADREMLEAAQLPRRVISEARAALQVIERAGAANASR
jgi:hypothetical protein